MDRLQKKTVVTKRSFTYTYYASKKNEENASKPTLFFIHGFPDSAHLWSGVVDHLSDLPYRIIAPDTLGYGGTSKPLDVEMYNYRDMTNDLEEILQAEDVQKAIVIGHDWGSILAQQFYFFHPEHVVGIILLNVAYRPPQEGKFDLTTMNNVTEKAFGYSLFAYWEFFTADDAPKIADENLDKMWEAMHGDEPEWMKKIFCGRGALRKYLLGNEHVPLKPYAKEAKWKDDFMQRFGNQTFEAPFNYYNATVNNVQSKSDADIPKELHKVQLPMLYIGCTGDAVCRSDAIEGPRKAGLLPDLEVQSIISAHWVPMEKPKEVAQHIRSFVTRRFP
ncbi:epoxide hydrolase [Exophiala viscosa]|uniref:Epoxide hydrolase n=1 Tax=Exophiala viscosa TaxID=2486360 RepID=A0AAN6DNB8_9EURO|nr:epoxide hydrolase [Exophiala viscosa]